MASLEEAAREVAAANLEHDAAWADLDVKQNALFEAQRRVQLAKVRKEEADRVLLEVANS